MVRVQAPAFGSTTSDSLAVSGETSTGTLTAGATAVSQLTASGNVTVGSNKFSVLASSGNTAVGGTLAVTGTTAVAAMNATTLAVTGNTTVGGTLGVTGAISVKDSSNAVKFSVSTGGQLYADGNTDINGTLDVTGEATFDSHVTMSNGVLKITDSYTSGGGGSDTPAFEIGTEAAIRIKNSHDGAGSQTILNIQPSANTYGLNMGHHGEACHYWGPVNVSCSECFRVRDGANSGAERFKVEASTGNTTIAGTLDVTGNTTIGGTLEVTGATTLTGGSVETINQPRTVYTKWFTGTSANDSSTTIPFGTLPGGDWTAGDTVNVVSLNVVVDNHTKNGGSVLRVSPGQLVFNHNNADKNSLYYIEMRYFWT